MPGVVLTRRVYTYDDGRTVVFEPWCDGHAVGFRCIDSDTGVESYVYFNPSTGGDSPDVFIYQGQAGDPAEDSPICYLNIPNEME